MIHEKFHLLIFFLFVFFKGRVEGWFELGQSDGELIQMSTKHVKYKKVTVVKHFYELFNLLRAKFGRSSKNQRTPTHRVNGIVLSSADSASVLEAWNLIKKSFVYSSPKVASSGWCLIKIIVLCYFVGNKNIYKAFNRLQAENVIQLLGRLETEFSLFTTNSMEIYKARIIINEQNNKPNDWSLNLVQTF